MKLTKYLPMMALAALMASCNEDPELPPVKGPESTVEANISILELKQQYWQTSSNYVATVGTDATGNDLIIEGTVISSDETGNIYKSLMINDGTAALTVAVNATKLYQTYQYGQKITINVTGMKIGGYNNLMQLGGEGTYNGQPSMTFMASDVMTAHTQQSGFGTPSNVEPYILTTDIATLMAAKSTAEGLQNWQSQLVRIKNVTFEDAGQPFAPTANTNRYFKDAQGNRMNLRCSSYSTFKNDIIPSGTGSVTAILSYYGSDWQMLLIDLSGLEGFDGTTTPDNPDNPDNPDTPDTPGDGNGSADAPYSVSQAMALNNNGATAWVKGYIVGVIDYDQNSSLVTTMPTNVATCIAIAATPDETDQANCMAVQLPVGDVRTALNLKDHPENLGKEVALQGELTKYFGMNGIKNTAAFTIDGQSGGGQDTPDTPTPPAPGQGEGNGTEATPYNCAAVIALGNPGTTGQWIEGYIIGVIDYNQNSSLVPGAETTVNTCIAIADSPSETDKNNCVAVQLPVGDVRTALNLVDNPGNLGKKVSLRGDLLKYFGIAGLKNTSAYTLE